MAHVYKHVATPVGVLKIVASDRGLSAILWEDDDPARVALGDAVEDPSHHLLIAIETQLGEYFDGRRIAFDLPLDMVGTAFQKQVGAALLTIPFGETRSYAAIARQIGRPGAARAVGAATGRNPVSIIAPCHRVLGSTGALTGFAGGLAVKEHLLGFERARA